MSFPTDESGTTDESKMNHKGNKLYHSLLPESLVVTEVHLHPQPMLELSFLLLFVKEFLFHFLQHVPCPYLYLSCLCLEQNQNL